MWTCSQCRQTFVNRNQVHSCNDKVLADFLAGKQAHTIALFWHFIESYNRMGVVTVHATKSMIAIAGTTRMAYVTKLGKNFVDIVFPFAQPFHDNLCFHKIAQVPGQQQFNHHFRMYAPEDVNEEVLDFMRKAYNKHR